MTPGVKMRSRRGKSARGAAARRAPARVSGNGLTSRSVMVPDALVAIETCYKRDWTDGLPVIPPTAPAIRGMLRAGRVTADSVLGEVRSLHVTAEKVAINAVM